MSNAPLDPPDPRLRDDQPTLPRGYDAYGGQVGTQQGGWGGQPGVQQTQPMPARNGIGTAALVVGIFALLLSPILIGGILGIVAAVLGSVALGRVKRREANNKGSAVAGVVLGLLAIAVSIAVGVLAYNNRDELDNLTDCLKTADTTAEQTVCNEKFADSVTK